MLSLQATVACVSVFLTIQTVSAIYNGPDASYYVRLQRWVRKGAAQQLASFRKSAIMYGIHTWNVDCANYKWSAYYGVGTKKATCSEQARGVYVLKNLGECAMNLVTPSAERWPMQFDTYVTPVYARTRCAAPFEPVTSHMTVSGGPGWYLIRFPVEEVFMYVQRFRLIYRQVGDVNWIKPRWPGAGTYAKVLPRVKPSYPCPPWIDFSMYCILVTDFIRIYDHSHQDYEGMLQTQGFIPPDDGDYQVKSYRFIFRVHYCDVTTEGDCPDLRTFKTDDSRRPPTMSAEDLKEKVGMVHDVDKEKHGLTLSEILMIVFLALLVVIAPLLFFIIYFCAKRRAVKRALHNWYFISAPNWPVHYTLRLPPELRRRPSDSSGSEVGEAFPGDNTYARMAAISQKPSLVQEQGGGGAGGGGGS